MSETSEAFVTEKEVPNSMYDGIRHFKTTDDYVVLAKNGTIPRPLLGNNEPFPLDSQNDPPKILDSFDVAISQDGRYSFLSRQ
jgi:hypothetical protein